MIRQFLLCVTIAFTSLWGVSATFACGHRSSNQWKRTVRMVVSPYGPSSRVRIRVPKRNCSGVRMGTPSPYKNPYSF